MSNNLLSQIEKIQHEPVKLPVYDTNYIILNRAVKFLLNFIISFIFLKYIIGNYPTITINQLILLFCTISSVLLYVLDLTYPSCSI